jgi:Uncharacterised protein family (UPF0149).
LHEFALFVRELLVMQASIVEIEQICAWLDRLRDDGRGFDFIQGYIAGLACASSIKGEPSTTELLLPFLDNREDYENYELPAGLDLQAVLSAVDTLYTTVKEDIASASFRPYMGGRYINRVRRDTPCSEWCRGFSLACLLASDELTGDEGLTVLLAPSFLLAGDVLAAKTLEALTEAERAEADERARKELVANVYLIDAYFESKAE